MAHPRPGKHAASGRLLGYARVSTEEQGTDPQRDELRAAGCHAILEEHASGADRSRPVLARLLRDIRAGETLVVVRLDRLARSVGHLLAVIEQLEARGAHFRSLRDPIDTATPQGMFSLQVLGAVAQLERALIAERTKAGLSAARARGRAHAAADRRPARGHARTHAPRRHALASLLGQAPAGTRRAARTGRDRSGKGRIGRVALTERPASLTMHRAAASKAAVPGTQPFANPGIHDAWRCVRYSGAARGPALPRSGFQHSP